jgi:DNA polymerase-3 subunit epsilon
MLHQTSFVAFDLETDSPDARDARIVTASIVSFRRGLPAATMRYLLQPARPIPDGAVKVHGISTEYAAEHGMDRAEGVDAIARQLAALWGTDTPLVPFNARYDVSVFHRECLRHGVRTVAQRPGADKFPVVDPMILDKQIDRYRRGSRTLGAVCAHYGVTLDGAHDATADATAAGHLAVAITRKHFDDWTPVELHDAQVHWARRQAEGLQRYFNRKTAEDGVPREPVDVDWPLIPLTDSELTNEIMRTQS